MLEWVAQYDLDGNLVGKYKNMRQAAIDNDFPYSSIKNVCDKPQRTLYGYRFVKECTDKEHLRNKTQLTIEEYMYLHGLSRREFAKKFGMAATCISYYLSRKSVPSPEYKEILKAHNIIYDWEKTGRADGIPIIDKKKGRKPGLRFYVNDEESIISILKVVSNKRLGRICCVSEVEAQFVSGVLKYHGVANYKGHNSIHGNFVKYDATLESDEID